MQEKLVLIIPSLDPDEHFLQLLHDIRGTKTGKEMDIVVVDDGSGQAYQDFFMRAEQEYGCKVLKHAVNLGKGRALKTAFNYCLSHYPELLGVVTTDADGQHAIPDIFACFDALREQPDQLILGSRNFDDSNVPLRSSFGNKLTRKVLGFLCGIHVSDTQTGLRGIPASFLRKLMTVPGERFEYEMNMLIACGENKIPIREIPIQTIYLEQNRASHFRPLMDSIQIYAVFFRFVLSGLSSFLVDILLFSILISLLKHHFASYIVVSTVLARVLSSLYNYFVNRNAVFRGEKAPGAIIRYYSLAVAQMLLSGFLVSLFYQLTQWNEVFFKMVVDLILFFVSFQVQKRWVFRSVNKGEAL